MSEILDIDEEEVEETEVGLPMPEGTQLRDYQVRAKLAIADGWKDYRRQLVVMATGCGKTVVFSSIIADEAKKGGRCLVLAHTEELVAQAEQKLLMVTGIRAEREKADEYASTGAKAVIASIQTISKDDRLTQFPCNHFTLVIVDECHHILARSYLKVVNYFHFGDGSLEPSWVMPEPGVPYKAGSRVLGFTATDDRGDRRNLGQFFESCPEDAQYGLLQACRDGYLVRPVMEQFPLQVDMKGVSMRGKDLDAKEVSERLMPYLVAIAKNVAERAKNRKTIIWLPSVDSARRLSEALRAVGMDANFVSGACPDRAEKIAAFRLAGKGSVMCNAMLLTEGVDIADVDCCMLLRPTKIRSLLVQAYGRGTRPLAGVIDGLLTKEERIAAIAASAKPNMLILDIVWHRLDLISTVELVTTRADMKDRMQALSNDGKAYDLLDLELGASRDLLKSLEAATRKNANKAARVLDPLAWAVDLGDAKLATYEPDTNFDRRPASPGQLEFLRKQHFDVTKITCHGQAHLVIGKLMMRYKMKMASPQQLHFLHQLGLAPEKAVLLSTSDASVTIDRILAEKKARRATAGTP